MKIGDTVAIFVQEPISLSATSGARLVGASLVSGMAEVKERIGGGADAAINTYDLFGRRQDRGSNVPIRP